MENYIPSEITNGTKQGFSAPDASWFKGESIDYVKRQILDKRAHIYKFLDRKSVTKFVNEHLEGKQNRRLFIWSLLSLEHWCDNYL
jgi:asparagine synthase (glutamine-hydrolysing)